MSPDIKSLSESQVSQKKQNKTKTMIKNTWLLKHTLAIDGFIIHNSGLKELWTVTIPNSLQWEFELQEKA